MTRELYVSGEGGNSFEGRVSNLQNVHTKLEGKNQLRLRKQLLCNGYASVRHDMPDLSGGIGTLLPCYKSKRHYLYTNFIDESAWQNETARASGPPW